MLFSVQQPQKDSTYSSYLELDLDTVEPCVSGPKRLVSSNAVEFDITT
jgi:aconitate hydratase